MEDSTPLQAAGVAQAARLDRTINDLKERVKEQEIALEKVHPGILVIPTTANPP